MAAANLSNDTSDLWRQLSYIYVLQMDAAEVSTKRQASLMSIRVNEVLRDEFVRSAQLNHESPTQALRNAIEGYVKETRKLTLQHDAAAIRAHAEEEADVLNWIAATAFRPMKAERGGIYTIAAKGAYSGKPRPALVVQANDLSLDSIVIIPLTSEFVGDIGARIALEETTANGLKVTSWAMCDKISTIPAANLKDRIGIVNDAQRRQIGIALRTVLDLLG